MVIPSYEKWADSVHRTISNFPVGFAFSKDQFEKQKKRLNVKSNDELVGIGKGGFIRKKDKEEFKKLFKYLDQKKKTFLKNPNFVYEMFLYELDNYEYVLSHNIDEVLDACNLTKKEINNNSMYYNCLEKAKYDYMKRYREYAC